MRSLAALLVSFIIATDCRPVRAQPFDCDGVATAVGESVRLELIASRLNDPVDIVADPLGGDRLFLVEQIGRIRIVDLADPTAPHDLFLDIRSRVRYGGERGLLGLAFHPDYAQNGYLFVNYTRNPNGSTIVARYETSANPDLADAGSERLLLTINQPFGNHNGGQLQFSPRDHHLYIGTGDGGSGGDPRNHGQNPGSLLAKMLRIDVDSGDPYGVPDDNPFVGVAGVRDEIWALGVRNPWRFSFDPLTHDLYIADVGQNAWEEIIFQPAESEGGENYEWRVREANHGYSSSTSYGPGIRQGAVFEYRHSGGAVRGSSISGGVVYRGCSMPDLSGRYFFADYTAHWVRSFRIRNGNVVETVNHTAAMNASVAGSVRSPVAFGHDTRGEIYLLDHQNVSSSADGRLYKIVPAQLPNNPPSARIVTEPEPPVVALADDGAEVLLDGTSSDSGDAGQELTYFWEKISGPEGDTIGRPRKESTLVMFTRSGEYRYRLTVDDAHENAASEVDVTVTEDSGTPLLRGDANADGGADISDGTYILGTLFLGFDLPTCADALDVNDTGTVDVSDAVALFNYLFLGGVAPADPGDARCGPDPTDEDGLGCESFPPCA